MKFYISFVLFLTFVNFSFSQETIKIPDVALEESLIDLKIDTNGLNGTILVSDARYVVNLNVSDPVNNKDLPNVHSKIKDLTGIEHFQNLKRLDCYGNEIHTINLTKNTELSFLNCSDNKIRELDLSNNTNLFFVSCDVNKITSLKLGSKPKLTELYCNANRLTQLDLKGCTALEAIDISSNKIDEVLISSSRASSIPDGWYKDANTVYVTAFGTKPTPKRETVKEAVKLQTSVVEPKIEEKPQITVNQQTTENVVDSQISTKITIPESKPQVKTYDENFKKTVVKEFEENLSKYIKIKKEELQLKYSLDEENLTNWIQEYGNLMKTNK